MKAVTIYTDGDKNRCAVLPVMPFCWPLAGQPQNMADRPRRTGAAR